MNDKRLGITLVQTALAMIASILLGGAIFFINQVFFGNDVANVAWEYRILIVISAGCFGMLGFILGALYYIREFLKDKK